MSYTTEKLPDAPVVLATFHADFDMAQEAEALNSDSLSPIEAQSEPVYYIADLSEYPPSLNDVMSAVNWGGPANTPTLRHPNVREAIFVSRSSMIKLAVQGLRSATWGHLKAHCFETLKEALAYTQQ
jgi:hypothetical protein